MLIKERLERCDFSNSERVIVNYILEHPKQIKHMTTKDIADATFTSPSTLIRIAHKMNFNGWIELKEAYLKEEEYLESHFSDIDANYPFENNDTIMSIATKLAKLKQESIEDTLSLITHDDLQKAVQIIRKSSSIYLFAVSNNGLISQEFAHRMSRIYRSVTICHIQGELIYGAATMDPNGCAIIMSYSGETPIFKRVIETLKARHIPIIGITNIGENTVANHADVTLKVCTREKLYSKIATFSTDISFEYILDLLYSCTFALEYHKNIERKEAISKFIETGRFSTVDILKEDQEF